MAADGELLASRCMQERGQVQCVRLLESKRGVGWVVGGMEVMGGAEGEGAAVLFRLVGLFCFC